MRLSSAGLELIESFEGLRLEAYPDPGTGGDPWTIGYGHTGPDVHKGLVITEVKANELLRGDVERFEQCVSSFVTPSINQNEYDALVSFTYNVGTTAFVNSTLLRLLNAGEPRSTVAEQFGRWVKGGNGETLAGLVTRREKESKLFLTPVKKNTLS